MNTMFYKHIMNPYVYFDGLHPCDIISVPFIPFMMDLCRKNHIGSLQ
jgi:hypothetical protein